MLSSLQYDALLEGKTSFCDRFGKTMEYLRNTRTLYDTTHEQIWTKVPKERCKTALWSEICHTPGGAEEGTAVGVVESN